MIPLLAAGKHGLRSRNRCLKASRISTMDATGPADFQGAAEFRASLRRFLRVSEDAARKNGLTPRRHLLLLMIKGAPGGAEFSTVSELCERLQLAQSTVTELVQRAEEAGLIRRDSAKDDGRVAHLTLTPEGERRLTRVHDDLRPERAALAEFLRSLEAEPAASRPG
jgi:DNA-binding MarR family transcriptional regulator